MKFLQYPSDILLFLSLRVLLSNTIKNDGVRRPNHGASDSATLIFTMNHGGEAAAEVGGVDMGATCST